MRPLGKILWPLVTNVTASVRQQRRQWVVWQNVACRHRPFTYRTSFQYNAIISNWQKTTSDITWSENLSYHWVIFLNNTNNESSPSCHRHCQISTDFYRRWSTPSPDNYLFRCTLLPATSVMGKRANSLSLTGLWTLKRYAGCSTTNTPRTCT